MGVFTLGLVASYLQAAAEALGIPEFTPYMYICCYGLSCNCKHHSSSMHARQYERQAFKVPYACMYVTSYRPLRLHAHRMADEIGLGMRLD